MIPDKYDDQDAISKSGLDKIAVSPLDYWYTFVRPERDPYIPDEKKIFDDALRCAVMTPKLFAQIYVKIPVLNKRKALEKAEFDNLLIAAERAGQVCLTADKYEAIRQMQDVILKHPSAKMLFSSGAVGIANRFREDNTGAYVKFKPHWINSGLIVNLMSTTDAADDNFKKEAWNFKHHKKAAIQIDGTGAQEMVFVNIEREPPYKIGIRYLDGRSVTLGRDTYIKNCATYVECLESDKWPGLPEKINPISLPEWVFNKY